MQQRVAQTVAENWQNGSQKYAIFMAALELKVAVYVNLPTGLVAFISVSHVYLTDLGNMVPLQLVYRVKLGIECT